MKIIIAITFVIALFITTSLVAIHVKTKEALKTPVSTKSISNIAKEFNIDFDDMIKGIQNPFNTTSTVRFIAGTTTIRVMFKEI